MSQNNTFKDILKTVFDNLEDVQIPVNFLVAQYRLKDFCDELAAEYRCNLRTQNMFHSHSAVSKPINIDKRATQKTSDFHVGSLEGEESSSLKNVCQYVLKGVDNKLHVKPSDTLFIIKKLRNFLEEMSPYAVSNLRMVK